MKYALLGVVLILAAGAGYVLFSQRQAGVGVHAADGSSGREEMAWREIDDGALLVDVRTPAEFAAGHLDGALNIPLDQIVDRKAELGSDLDRSIVLYCRTGHRSGLAEKALEGVGFTHLLNGGGYKDLVKVRDDMKD